MVSLPLSLRTRLTLWYVAVLAVLLLLYAAWSLRSSMPSSRGRFFTMRCRMS